MKHITFAEVANNGIVTLLSDLRIKVFLLNEYTGTVILYSAAHIFWVNSYEYENALLVFFLFHSCKSRQHKEYVLFLGTHCGADYTAALA